MLKKMYGNIWEKRRSRSKNVSRLSDEFHLDDASLTDENLLIGTLFIICL